MIYVIKSAAYISADSDETENILKIGYCGEDRKKARFSAYQTENPTFKTLYLIPGGTPEDEGNLHLHFKEFKKSYGQEWFSYSDNIINFFKENQDINSIRDKLIFNRISPKKYRISDLRKFFWPYVKSIEGVLGYKDYSIYETCEPTEESAIMWITKKYPDLAGSIIQDHDINEESITPEMREFIVDLQNTKIRFSERLKFLFETDKLTEDEKKVVSQQASEVFDKYYNLVGPERCKALGYDVYLLKREISDLQITKDEIFTELSKVFQVGQKYTNKEAKDLVKQAYSNLELYKSPKASDLSEYYEIKPTKVLVSGKWEHGFEILKLKEL